MDEDREYREEYGDDYTEDATFIGYGPFLDFVYRV